MPVSIVVGGQYGSEGKGKVAHYLTREMEATYVVRCGGPNSGHTVIDESGNARIFQQLPTASILEEPKLAICAGSYIDLDILQKEINETGVSPDRLIIDPDAVVITEELKQRERKSGLVEDIGSTGSGTGAAVASRVNRKKTIKFANDCSELKPYINDVPSSLRTCLGSNERIIIEGTQGFGLSPLHSRHYPFCTSRDTTAAAFLSEAGLSPLDVDDITLTIRAFPIRVAGNSGPLPEETNWNQISNQSMNGQEIIERSSVTNNIRRVAGFSSEVVIRAIQYNKPTRIVLNHLDYMEEHKVDNFTEEIEKKISRPINMLGFGPGNLIVKG